MKEKHLLLFDADGVLLQPHGYEKALIDTLEVFMDKMGLPPYNLKHEEIAFFESNGITNEWLSGAIMLGDLLIEIATIHPELIGESFSTTAKKIKQASVNVSRPPLSKRIEGIIEGQGNEISETPLKILNILKTNSHPDLHHLLDELLKDVRPLAPFSNIFQMHTLGSEAYSTTYGIETDLSLKSYLLTYDITALTDQSLNTLKQLNDAPLYGMTIYTARPGLPPRELTADEMSEIDLTEHPPEADLVIDLSRFSFSIPLISGGRMSWLAIEDGVHAGSYIKPSPLHGLAAIAAAFSGSEKNSLEGASALWNKGLESGPFAAMREYDLTVYVFEDSPTGMHSILEAVKFLNSYGYEITSQCLGISTNPEKREALNNLGDKVYDNVNLAIQDIVIL